MSVQRLTPLVTVATTDLVAVTRGRPVPAARLEAYAATGVSWVPANLCLTAFGGIATPNPFGSAGDLRLIPDLDARFASAATGSETPFDMVMGNLAELDGAPWAACPRAQLIDALAALKARTGFSVIAAFEQEFRLWPLVPGEVAAPAHAFSHDGLRRLDPFAPRLFACLEDAGIDPEMVLPEYGRDQFEVTHGPADALVAADRAIAIREITREVARHCGQRASFAPKPAPAEVGNGVHIHFSLRDAKGEPATYDPHGPSGMSAAAGSFSAGVLRHLPALLALTAPTTSSYYRLEPHNWSASYTWLGERDREATLRICPTVTIGGRNPAKQFNIEYRAADALANPYLAMAGIVRAGLAGLEENLPAPPVASGDPTLMDAATRERLGLYRLPESIEAALAALEGDAVASKWLPPVLLESYLTVKRAEIGLMAGLDREAICAAYGARY